MPWLEMIKWAHCKHSTSNNVSIIVSIVIIQKLKPKDLTFIRSGFCANTVRYVMY